MCTFSKALCIQYTQNPASRIRHGTITVTHGALHTRAGVNGNKIKGRKPAPGVLPSGVKPSFQAKGFPGLCFAALTWKRRREAPTRDLRVLPRVCGHKLRTWSRVLSESARAKPLTDSWEQPLSSWRL